jgi:hypothetical protein
LWLAQWSAIADQAALHWLKAVARASAEEIEVYTSMWWQDGAAEMGTVCSVRELETVARFAEDWGDHGMANPEGEVMSCLELSRSS